MTPGSTYESKWLIVPKSGKGDLGSVGVGRLGTNQTVPEINEALIVITTMTMCKNPVAQGSLAVQPALVADLTGSRDVTVGKSQEGILKAVVLLR